MSSSTSRPKKSKGLADAVARVYKPGTESKSAPKAPWSNIEIAAALGAKLEAEERHAKSALTYRHMVTSEVFGNHLKKLCGEDGATGDWLFPVKHRPPSSGGDWTMALSIELRSKNGKAIYAKADEAEREIKNSFNPLFRQLFPNGNVGAKWELPSGTNVDDAYRLMEYNVMLKQQKKSKSKVAEGAVRQDEGEGVGVRPARDDEEVSAQAVVVEDGEDDGSLGSLVEDDASVDIADAFSTQVPAHTLTGTYTFQLPYTHTYNCRHTFSQLLGHAP